MGDLATGDVHLTPELTRQYLLHHGVCPDRFTSDGQLIVAVAPDAFTDSLDDLAFVYRCPVRADPRSRDEVNRLVERVATRTARAVELSDTVGPPDEYGTDVRNLANQAPVVRYVNLLVQDAYDAQASDIHLEATRSGMTVRLRLDGVLVPTQEPSAGMHEAVVSRIKLLADMDVAERRRPQDGRIRVRLEARELDLRVSTVPTMFGESVVLRLLDRGGRPVELTELGMSPAVLSRFERLIQRADGMVLVTGPTGSGKTTTLYAALQRRLATTEKIITVEDPVEYELPGIVQVPVHPHAGVSFGSVLRSILRQDPDVLMIGEMRDTETAEIGVQAAMTGHLVFATLHTNDAVGAFHRLLDLGVPDYLVAATVEGVLAQRLVRRVCGECCETYAPPPDVVALIAGRPVERTRLLRGKGCAACRETGYRGRVGIFELLVATETLTDALVQGAPRSQLRELALSEGMIPLRTDGWAKVQAGLTTVEEVLRVTED